MYRVVKRLTFFVFVPTSHCGVEWRRGGGVVEGLQWRRKEFWVFRPHRRMRVETRVRYYCGMFCVEQKCASGISGV